MSEGQKKRRRSGREGPNGLWLCRGCELYHELKAFGLSKKNSKYRLVPLSLCKKCDRDASVKRHARDRARRNERARFNAMRHKYGIGKLEYERMLRAQRGACAICFIDKPVYGKVIFSVDHCHKSGVIRGLLCDSCNFMIGQARDNPTLLLSGAAYLESRRNGARGDD